jgi:hypothetical protein
MLVQGRNLPAITKPLFPLCSEMTDKNEGASA